MKKIYLILKGFAFSAIAFCQPYHFTQSINPADTSLVSLEPSGRRVWEMLQTPWPIVIDGIVDDKWAYFNSKEFDRYIMCRTSCTAGVYSCEPDATPNRTPDNKDDFSGSYRITYDEDFLYLLFDVKDNEVNDGVINLGVSERLEIVEAPYPDSAQQLLQGKPFPPFSGVAPELNMKFCYWNYLGAFQFNFTLKDTTVDISIYEKADATKINYEQRKQSCLAAWKFNEDGSGYILEVALNFKVALADSANNPYTTISPGERKFIAFDMFIIDKDKGRNQIKASWNAQDDCVWDNMLYTGKLRFPWIGALDGYIEKITFYPNPASEMITLSQKVTKAEIYSITGVLMKSEQNTEQLNVSDLPQGLYIVKADGVVIGKMVKE